MRAAVILAILLLVVFSGLTGSLMVKAPYEKQDLKQDVLGYSIGDEIEAFSGRNAEQLRHVSYIGSNGKNRLETVLYIYSGSSASNSQWSEAKAGGDKVKVSRGKAYMSEGCTWRHKNAVLHMESSQNSISESELRKVCKDAPEFLETESLLAEKTGLLN